VRAWRGCRCGARWVVGWRLDWAARLLETRLQRYVHLLEPGIRLLWRTLDETDEDAGEALRLDEAAPAVLERLDPKAVLTVEEAGDKQAAEPTQLAVWLDGANGGLERDCAPAPCSSLCTSSLAPARSSPLIREMNGFHSG
jgi:hypothetical protein